MPSKGCTALWNSTFKVDYLALSNFIVLINIVTVFAFALDKYLAISNRYRIPEKHLLFLALLGGSIGAITAQQLFRHKTQKFKYVLWMILSVHLILGWIVYS